MNELLLPWLPKESAGFNFLFKDLFISPQIWMSKMNEKIDFSQLLIKYGLNQNYAVLGNAGMGKSTLLRYVYIYESDSVICFYVNALSLVNEKQSEIEKIVSRIIYNDYIINEDILLLIDGVDEAFANDVDRLNQIIEQISHKQRVTLWIGCRTDLYYRSIGQTTHNIFYDNLTIREWSILQSEDYVKIYSEKTNNRSLFIKYKVTISINTTIVPFLENPFKLSLLLLFLLEINEDTEVLIFNNFYYLYDKFYTHWIFREHTRGTSTKKTKEVLKQHYKIARELYGGKQKILKNTQLDSAITGLLLLEKDIHNKYTVIKGFYHQSLLEFVIAKKVLETLENGGLELIEGLTYLYLNDVTDFIKEGFKLTFKNQLNKIKINLEKIYMQLHKNDCSLSKKECDFISKLDSYKIFTLKDQIIYFISRIPNIDAIDFIKYVNEKETNDILKLNIAYAASLVGPFEIALNYAKKLSPQSREDETNRSWTLVYYGDVEADAYSYKDDGLVSWKKARGARIRRLKSNENKALRFRMFDLRLLYTFFESRGWNDLSCEELDIIKKCNIYSEDLTNEVLEFLNYAKEVLVSAYEEHLMLEISVGE